MEESPTGAGGGRIGEGHPLQTKRDSTSLSRISDISDVLEMPLKPLWDIHKL